MNVFLICYMLFIQYYISVILIAQRIKQIETW